MSSAIDAPAADRVRVALGSRSYEVVIGTGLIDSGAGLPEARGDGAMIVTNSTVRPLYAARLERALGERFSRIDQVELEDGEAHKDWASVTRIVDALTARRHDRQVTLYALGGGVVGDVAGFAAACYMRGVDYVQVPTTLLAQVDSSVGGKTAINHPAGKNLIGAFHQPVGVIADTAVLATLPRRELLAGLAEVIKHGVIADDNLFAWLEEALPQLLDRDPAALAWAVRRSCEIKAEVVGADEHETGRRAILNFGHTFGHAIEAALGYGSWLHGEAVACGMVMAARLSVRLGLADAERADRLERLLERAGLPTRLPALDIGRFVELMAGDKKAVRGQFRFVLLEGRTGVRLSTAPMADVQAAIECCMRPGNEMNTNEGRR